jgi:hypothetical protein
MLVSRRYSRSTAYGDDAVGVDAGWRGRGYSAAATAFVSV